MSLPRGAVVVFAKQPRAGAVKTRMTPPLAPSSAAELYACMLADVLDVTAAAAQQLELDAVLAVHPEGAVPALAREAPPRFRVVAQRGVDLARRMSWAARETAASGARRILLRGSDSPALEASHIAEALCALDDSDVVLSPDLDGGYNLVGLRAPSSGLFDHPMSTGRVLDDTLANARRARLRTRLLEPSFDLDGIGDLRRLAAVRTAGRAAGCPRTLACADRLELWSHLSLEPPSPRTVGILTTGNALGNAVEVPVERPDQAG